MTGFTFLFFCPFMRCLVLVVPVSFQAHQAFWVVPILATAPGLCRPESQALEHGSLFSLWVVLFSACAEVVLEVVVVLVLGRKLLRVNSTGAGYRVGAQHAWGCGRQSFRAAVADEITSAEELDQVVLAVARDGARIAYACRCVDLRRRGWWRAACEAGKDGLAERS